MTPIAALLRVINKIHFPADLTFIKTLEDWERWYPTDNTGDGPQHLKIEPQEQDKKPYKIGQFVVYEMDSNRDWSNSNIALGKVLDWTDQKSSYASTTAKLQTGLYLQIHRFRKSLNADGVLDLRAAYSPGMQGPDPNSTRHKE